MPGDRVRAVVAGEDHGGRRRRARATTPSVAGSSNGSAVSPMFISVASLIASSMSCGSGAGDVRPSRVRYTRQRQPHRLARLGRHLHAVDPDRRRADEALTLGVLARSGSRASRSPSGSSPCRSSASAQQLARPLGGGAALPPEQLDPRRVTRTSSTRSMTAGSSGWSPGAGRQALDRVDRLHAGRDLRRTPCACRRATARPRW